MLMYGRNQHNIVKQLSNYPINNCKAIIYFKIYLKIKMIHFDIWQNWYSYVKFKNKIKLKKKKDDSYHSPPS